MKKIYFLSAIFFSLVLAQSVSASGSFNSNPGTCNFDNNGIVTSCTDEPFSTTYIGQKLHTPNTEINGDMPYLILYDNNGDMYYGGVFGDLVLTGTNKWYKPLHLADELGITLFVRIVQWMAALVGILAFVASTKFGFKLIKKAFPNAY